LYNNIFDYNSRDSCQKHAGMTGVVESSAKSSPRRTQSTRIRG